uniref:Peptidase S1 domain-containing protein n=1 Tax=Oryzias sinensis TaxID=183150 RepID=A0A8C7XGC3_9TELE
MTLTMALQQFVCRLTLLTLLFCSGFPPVVVTDNSTPADNGSPETSPWMVYVYSNSTADSQLECVGSLITDQWVLVERICVSSYSRDTTLVLGIQNRLGDNPNAVNRSSDEIICNFDSTPWKSFQICLMKLSSPVDFTSNIQAIPLASDMSTFDDGISIWSTVLDVGIQGGTLKQMKEVEASITINDQCELLFETGVNSETAVCVRIGGPSLCKNVIGSQLVTKERCQWVLLGVSYHKTVFCGATGVFIRVSLYQDWIREIIPGMQPTFVTINSTGNDADVNFPCSTEISTNSTTIGKNTTPTAASSTVAPTATTTVTPTDTTTICNTIIPTTTTSTLTPPTTDDSIFSGCDNLSPFTHFLSLCSLFLFLHVLVGGIDM